ncbi:unnamed protein product [Ixodes persulcatus]
MHSKIAGYCHYNCSTMESRHVALHLICRTANPWYANLIPHPYWATLSAVTSNLNEFNLSFFQSAVAGKDDFEKLRNGGNFHIVVRDEQILIAGSYDVRCLNCTPDASRYFPIGLKRHMPIRGREITIACLEPLICQSPSFSMLTESLIHDNCSLKIFQVSNIEALKYYIGKSMVDSGTLFYYPFVFRQDLYFPTMSTLFHFDSAGFATFVRALEPLPKEAVLFLPFGPYVWVTLSACLIIFLFICFFAQKVLQNVSDFHAVAALLAASLVQQAYPVPPDAANAHSLRILFGVWYLMVTVLTTGYKGVITSLLCNVPLSGELPQYVTFKDVEDLGSAACLVNFPEAEVVRVAPRWAKKPNFDCWDGLGKLRVGNGTDAVFVFRPSSDEAASLKDELFRVGFVRMDTLISPIITGPQIKSNSAYYRSMNKLLGRAFGAGLFERAEEMAELKSRVRREIKYGRPSETGDAALGLSDLQPCFVIWAIGVVLSLLTFAVSHVVAHFRPLRPRLARHPVRQAW